MANIFRDYFGAPNYSEEQLAGDDYESAQIGITNVLSGLSAFGSQIANRLGLELPEATMAEWASNFRQEALDQTAQLSPKRQADLNAPLMQSDDFLASLWAKGLSSLPSMLATAAAGVAGGAVAGPPGAAAGVAGMSGALTGGETVSAVQAAVDQLGLPPDKAKALLDKTFSTGADLISGGLGALAGLAGPEAIATVAPIRRAIGELNLPGRLISGVTIAGAGEAVEGAIPPATTNLARSTAPEAGIPEQSVAQGAIEEGIIGAIIGGGVSTVAGHPSVEKIDPGMPDAAETAALSGEPLPDPLALPHPRDYPIPSGAPEPPAGLLEPPRPTTGGPVNTPDVINQPGPTAPLLQLEPPGSRPASRAPAVIEAGDQSIPDAAPSADPLVAPLNTRRALVDAGFQPDEIDAWDHEEAIEAIVSVQRERLEQQGVLTPAEVEDAVAELRQQVEAGIEVQPDPALAETPIEGAPKPTDLRVVPDGAPAVPTKIVTPGVTLAEPPVEEAIPTSPPPVEGPVPGQGAPRRRPPRPAPTTLPPEINVSEAPPITTPENAPASLRVTPTAPGEEPAAPAPLPDRQRTIAEIFSPTEGMAARMSAEPVGQTAEGAPILEAAPTLFDQELAYNAKQQDTPEDAKSRRQIETDYPQFAGRTDLSVDDIIKRIKEDPQKAGDLIAANEPFDEADGDAIGVITRLEHMLEQAAANDIAYPGDPNNPKGRVSKNTPDEIMFLSDAMRTVKALTKNLNNVEALLQFQANEQAARAGDYSLMRSTFGGKSAGRSGGVGGAPGGVENIAGEMQAVDVEDAARREEAGTVGSVEDLGTERPESLEPQAAPTPSSRRGVSTYDPYIWVTDEKTGVQRRIKNPVAKGVELNVTPELESAALAAAPTAEARGASRAAPRATEDVKGQKKGRSGKGVANQDVVVRKISADQAPPRLHPPKTAEAIAKSKAKQEREQAAAIEAARKKAAQREAKEAKGPTKAEQAKAASAERKAAKEREAEQKRVAKAQEAERKARAKVEETPKKETFTERQARIFREIAERRASGTSNASVGRGNNYAKTDTDLSHKAGAVNFFGKWVEPNETLTLGEAASRFPTRDAGTPHGELVDKILQLMIKTRPDMPVYVFEDTDMAAAAGGSMSGTVAFYSHPDLAGSPHQNTGFIGIRADSFVRSVLGHEGIHTLTNDMLNNSPAVNKQLERVLAEILMTKEVFPDSAQHAPSDAKYYGLENVREMLSEITNPDFAQLLHEVPIPRDLAKAMGLEGWRKATAWNGIVAAVRKMFNRMLQMIGVAPVNDFNAFDAVMATIERASHTYDTPGLAAYQSRALLSGALGDINFQHAEQVSRNTRNRVHAIEQSRTGERDESFLNPVPESDAKRSNEEINTRATLEVVRAVKQRGGDTWSRIGKGSLYFRSLDSIMRGYEHLFPEGVLRRVVNALTRRDTLARQLHALDAKMITAHARLFDKHRDTKIGGRSAQDVYESSVHDQTNWQIDASIPLAQNTWLGDDKVSASHYAAIKKEYDTLPADMKAAMKKQFVWARDKQQRAMDGVLTNTVLNAVKEPMTPAAALKLGRRIVAGEATNADVEAIGKTAHDKIKATPEFKMLEGPYAPMMRYGDHIVSAKVDIADPKSGKWRKVSSPQSYIVDFYGPDAEDQATKFASNREEFAKVTPVWTDAQGRAEINGEPFTRKDVISGAVKSYRVTIQDSHVEFFETEREAIDAAEKLKGDKYYRAVKPVRLKADTGETDQQAYAGSRQIQSIMAELGKRDALAGLPPKIRAAAMEAVQQAVYRAAPGTSISKRRMQRRHVAGSSKDSLRAMQAYSHSMNNYIAGIETAHEIHESFTAAQESTDNNYAKGETPQAVLNELSQRRNARAGAYDPSSPMVNALTSWQFIDKLASPAYSIINLTQPALVTLPHLASKFGLFNASRAMAKAYSDIGFTEIMKAGGKETVAALRDRLHSAVSYHDFVTKNNPKVSGNKVRMLDKLVEYGSLDPDAGFEASKVRALGLPSTILKRVEDTFRQMPRAIEASNRYTTALAAYELAIKKGMKHDAAVEYARDAVDSTQFNYSASNASPIFNTAVGRVAFQFMKYGAFMYQHMGAQIATIVSSKSKGSERAEAIKGLTYLIGAHVVMAGFGGLPLEPLRLMVTAANMFGVTDLQWEDVEAGAREIAASMVGTTAAEAMTRGLPRLLGIDVANRVNLTDMLVHRPQVGFDERGGIGAYMWQFAGGATGGSMIDIPDGIRMLLDGEYVQAFEKLVPIKAVTDISAAVRQGTVGKQSTAHDPVMKFDLRDMIVKGFGFNPASNANVSERRATVARETNYQQSQRESILLDYYDATPDQRGKFGPRLAAYNKGLSASERLTPADLRDYVRTKIAGQRKAKGTVIPHGNTSIIEHALETIPE